MIGWSSKHRVARFLVACLLAIAAYMPIAGSPFVDRAAAQEVRERRSIIDFLFRGDRPRQRTVIKQPPAVVRIKPPRKPKVKTVNNDTAVTAVDIEIPKLADAKKVLVIGDFNASALSDGLTMSMVNDADIVIEKGSDGSSGLVRTDHLDWPVKLKQQISEIKPALIVIMLGSNDRQSMSIGGQKEKFRSEAWNAEYERRVSALIKVATDAKIPFIWTGLPSFQSPSLSADAATLNSLFRTKTEAAGGVFIDIWDGFADEDGKFIASGSDVNGQPVRLRGSDGLSLTRAGKRKMAFYLEKDLRRLTGTDEIANLIRLDSSNLPLDSNPTTPAIANVMSVPPVSLADPELDGTSQLLDTGLLPKASGKSPRDLLIEKGETETAPDGRVDDFTWKPAVKPAG